MNGGTSGPSSGIDPTSLDGELDQHLGREVVRAPLHDAEGGLEAFLLTARHETVEAVEVELIVDRVRELVGQHELLDPVELGVAGVDELLVLRVVEAEDLSLLIGVDGLQVSDVARQRADRLPRLAPASVGRLG